jgi:DNA-binding SARP family transcriptional activator/tetratricopeptide (TPR) repeat protein
MAQFRVLGPVELVTDRPVDLGPAKQQAVLAALLVDVGLPVSVDVLVDRVWGHAPPEQVRAALYAYVARLRSVLRGIAEIGRRGGGYQLMADPEQIDLHHARRLADRSRDVEDPAERAGLLDQALAQWRGIPLYGLSGAWVEAVRERLVQERIDATAQWAEAGLALGRVDAVIARTRPLAEEFPLVEPLTEVLIRALAAAGRGAEALTCFDRIRRLLRDELGADPGPRLRATYADLLVLTSGGPAPAVSPVPAQLPMDVRGFTGREPELAVLDRLLAAGASRVVVSAVAGTAGVGKTALAVHWAHRAAGRFPDGQLYLDLRGYGPDPAVPAEEALAACLRALGLPAGDLPAALPERAARYRTELAGRRMLVVLDNACSAEQVRPLLPGAGESAVLVTSRDSLAGLVSRDGAHRLDLDLLPLADAVTLLQELIGTRVQEDPVAAEQLAQSCARLPLALRVAAELAAARPSTSLSALVSELQQGAAGDGGDLVDLDRLDGGGDRHSAVRAVLSWSYRNLDAGAARLFRLLGLHPGKDWDAAAAAALAGEPVAGVRCWFDGLIRAHLVRPIGPGRFAMHDLLRSYAGWLADRELDPVERAAGVRRLCDHYLGATRQAMVRLHPTDPRPEPRSPDEPSGLVLSTEAEALAWLEEERANLVTLCGFAVREGRLPVAVDVAATIFRYLDAGAYGPEALQVHTAAAGAARSLGRPRDEAVAVKNLAGAHWRRGDYAQAQLEAERALSLARVGGDALLEGIVLSNLGILCQCRGQLRAALEHHEAAGEIFGAIGPPLRQWAAWSEAGLCLVSLGRYAEAEVHLHAVVDLAHTAGDRHLEACAAENLALLRIRQGRLAEAEERLRNALRITTDLGTLADQALSLARLGELHLRCANPAAARAALDRALTIARSVGERSIEAEALFRLGEADRLLGRQEQALVGGRQALAVLAEIGYRPHLAAAHNALGETLAAGGRTEESLAEHRAALAAASETGSRYDEGQARLGLAEAYAALGRPAEAEREQAAGQRIFTRLGVPAPA